MANVLLIVPPLYARELFARGSKSSASLLPPLGLAYLAAVLREDGHELAILDGIAQPEPFEAILARAQRFDVVGISAVSTYVVRCVELIQALKRGGLRAPIVVGGPHVSVLPESLLDRGADYAVVGEGEWTFRELVNALAAGRTEPTDVKGLVLRAAGGFQYTGPRAPIHPLDQIPLPARDLLPMHLYRGSQARARKQPAHSMLTSRGCPGVCSFCSKRTFGTHVRSFSCERIVEEMFLLRDRHGARDVQLWDDNFLSDRELVHRVCDALLQKGFRTSWSVEARIDGVDRDVLNALKRAGCEFIAYGIESGSQRVLDYINKRIDKEQIRETIRMTQAIGIAIRGYFMLGFPGESAEEMRETIRFADELDVEIASFTLFTPLPGTLEYRRALKTGTFRDPEYFYHRIVPEFNFPDQPIYVPEGLSARELLDIHRGAYNAFYFRPKRLARHLLAARSPHEVRNLVHGGMTLVSNMFHRGGDAEEGGRP